MAGYTLEELLRRLYDIGVETVTISQGVAHVRITTGATSAEGSGLRDAAQALIKKICTLELTKGIAA